MGTPRWVKVFGIVLVVVILVLVIVFLTRDSGGHGPSRHMGGLGNQTQSAGITDGDE